MSKRIYLAGPMSGIENHNYPRFHECAEIIRREFHYEVISPAELHPEAIHLTPEEATARHAEYLTADYAALITCDAVAVMGGFGLSRGAMWEVHTALVMGMPVYLAPNMSLYEPATLWGVISSYSLSQQGLAA